MKWAKRSSYGKEVDSESKTGRETPQPKLSFWTKIVAYFNLGFFVVNLLFLATTTWIFVQQKSPSWILRQMNTYCK